MNATSSEALEAAAGQYPAQGLSDAALHDLVARIGGALSQEIAQHGAKNAVLVEIYRLNMAPVNAERLILLEAALARSGGKPVGLPVLVDAIARPLESRAIASALGRHHALDGIVRWFSEPLATRKLLFEEIFRDVFDRFVVELERSLPGISRDELLRRLQVAISTLLATCARIDMIANHDGEPVTEQELWKVVETLHVSMCEILRQNPERAGQEEIVIRDGKRALIVALDQILSITADSNYSLIRIQSMADAHMRRSIRQWETLLPSAQFIRINRNTIVNIGKIQEVRALPDARMTLSLDGIITSFPVSRRRRGLLAARYPSGR